MSPDPLIPGPILNALHRLQEQFDLQPGDVAVVVDPAMQALYLVKDLSVRYTYPVSTGLNGLGNREGSYQTPVGVHSICQRIGAEAVCGTVFKGREQTGELAEIVTDPVSTGQDAITTRILRLIGLEPGVNKGPGIDTCDRYIYIHGTPEEGLIGRPVSHGCIRMTNRDITVLFDQVQEGTLVYILDRPFEQSTS